MSIANPAVLVLATACLASFSWAMQRFFLRPDRESSGLNIVTAAGSTSAVAHAVALVAAPAPGGARVGAALVLYATSLGLFWSAIATLRRRPLSIIFARDTPVRLVATGPYRWLRHPLYSSYSLAWLAGLLASRAAWLAIPVAVMIVLYVRAARAEEVKFATSALAAAYADYRDSTGGFVPWRRPAPASGGEARHGGRPALMDCPSPEDRGGYGP